MIFQGSYFGRFCKVSIGNNGNLAEFLYENAVGLDISVDFTRTLTNVMDTGLITIRGVHSSKRTSITKATESKDDIPIRVEAGYDDRKGLLFEGQILNPEAFGRTGKEIRIPIADGFKGYRASLLDVSGKAGSLVSYVQKVMDAFGGGKLDSAQKLVLSEAQVRAKAVSFANGVTAYQAKPSRALDDIARRFKLVYSVQNGKVRFEPADPRLPRTPVTQLTIVQSVAGLEIDSENGNIGFSTFMDPSLISGSFFLIQGNPRISPGQVYRVVTAQFRGSTMSGQWAVKVDGEKVSAII